MDASLTAMEKMVHLGNLYLIQKYEVTVLETNMQTVKFLPMGRYLDKQHHNTVCASNQYVPIAIDSRHVYGLCNSGSNVIINLLRLTEALGLQFLLLNGTFWWVANHLLHFVGRRDQSLFSCMIRCNLK